MKKLLSVSAKAVVFFIGWAVLASVVPLPDTEDPAAWRFGAELMPMLAVVLFSAIFYFAEKRDITIVPLEKPLKNALLGIVLGAVWTGVSFIIVYLWGAASVSGMNHVSRLWLWVISCFVNVVMQELLVRGYLYQMIKKNYSTAAAAAVTSVLFLLCHGGALEAGIIPILNILTMSVFMTLALEYTDSFIMPVMLHFVWNCAGSIVLGAVSLADDYPKLLNISFGGSNIVSGGSCKLEGSIVVLAANIIFIAVFAFLLYKKHRSVGNKPEKARNGA